MTKHLLLALAVFAVFLWAAVLRKGEGADLPCRIKELTKEAPDTVLVGNSVLKAGVDEDRLSELIGGKALKVTSNGSASAWWYLYVRNVLAQADHKPKRVMIFFRDTYLTDPTFRTSGKFRTPLRRISCGDEVLVWECAYSGRSDTAWQWAPAEAKERFERRLLKMGAELLGANKHTAEQALDVVFDDARMQQEVLTARQLAEEVTEVAHPDTFEVQLERSLLPALLDILEGAGIDPVFVRCKRRRDVDADGEPQQIKAYMADLSRYLNERGASLIDLTAETTITLEHYGAGDHLNGEGQRLFTEALSEKIKEHEGAVL